MRLSVRFLVLALSLAASLPPALAQAPASDVVYVWVGGVTPTSAEAVAKLLQPAESVRWVLSDGEDTFLSQPQEAVFDNGRIVRLPIEELEPETQYRYTLEIDGELVEGPLGSFETFGRGEYSFKMVASSCAQTGSRSAVFTAIRDREPDLFFHLGDLHYEDIARNEVGIFLDAYQRAVGSPVQSQLFRSAPIAYMWDDHDFGPNDSNATSPSREAAREAYRITAPYYPLVYPEGDNPVHHAFSVGRVRFVVTDLRSQRDPPTVSDFEGRSMMGEPQRRWLLRELREARDTHALTVWVSTVTWIDNSQASGDTWAGFSTERFLIADFIHRNEIENLVIVSADAHMVAMDDGSNSQYAVTDDPGPVVIQASPLDRRGSYKGGPFSEGSYAPTVLPFRGRPGQFVELEFDDRGDELCMTATGYRADEDDGDLDELTGLDRCYAVSEAVQRYTEAQESGDEPETVIDLIEDIFDGDDAPRDTTATPPDSADFPVVLPDSTAVPQDSTRESPSNRNRVIRDAVEDLLERFPNVWRRVFGF